MLIFGLGCWSPLGQCIVCFSFYEFSFKSIIIWTQLVLWEGHRLEGRRPETSRVAASSEPCSALVVIVGLARVHLDGLHPQGVLNFHFVRGVRPVGPKMGAGRTDRRQILGLIELIFWQKCCLQNFFLAQMRLPKLDFWPNFKLRNWKFTKFKAFWKENLKILWFYG